MQWPQVGMLRTLCFCYEPIWILDPILTLKKSSCLDIKKQNHPQRLGWVWWWPMPLTPELERQRQKDL